MGRPSKGLTWAFRLRATEEDRAAVHATVDEYAEYDITISLNDAIRILVQRARRRPVDSILVVSELKKHRAECGWCTPEAIGCPEGARLNTSAEALARLVRGAAAPSPPESEPLPGVDGYAEQLAGRVQRLTRGPFGVTIQP